MDRLSLLKQHLKNTLLVEDYPQSKLITLNRPQKLNALNSEMMQGITLACQEATSKNIIFRGSNGHLSAGGDVISLVTYPFTVTEFYRSINYCFNELQKHKGKVISIAEGYTLGGGAALCMASNLRVFTPSTKFAMPENSIGFVPDVGAGHFFSHLPCEAVGLYLMLTGVTIDGNDCYWAGIAHYYVKEVGTLVEELKTAKDPQAVTEKHHEFPPREASFIVKNWPEIEAVFSNVNCVEEVLQRLAVANTPFKEKTFREVCKLCPLSLKVCFRAFKRAKSITYKECLEQDYNLAVQMCLRRSLNYSRAVHQKFIKKDKQDPQWQPSSITEITEQMLDVLFSNPEGPFLKLNS